MASGGKAGGPSQPTVRAGQGPRHSHNMLRRAAYSPPPTPQPPAPSLASGGQTKALQNQDYRPFYSFSAQLSTAWPARIATSSWQTGVETV